MISLDVVQERVAACKRCPLRAGCGQVVLGSGDPRARVVLVAYQADAEADLLGRPLVNRAGRHFRSLLDRAGVADACYLTYLVKCKGPASRESAAQCRYNLWDELKSITPRFVVPLGLDATNRLLRVKALKDVAGRDIPMTWWRGDISLSPWYTPEHVLLRGKSFDDKTVAFFKTLKGDF